MFSVFSGDTGARQMPPPSLCPDTFQTLCPSVMFAYISPTSFVVTYGRVKERLISPCLKFSPTTSVCLCVRVIAVTLCDMCTVTVRECETGAASDSLFRSPGQTCRQRERTQLLLLSPVNLEYMNV